MDQTSMQSRYVCEVLPVVPHFQCCLPRRAWHCRLLRRLGVLHIGATIPAPTAFSLPLHPTSHRYHSWNAPQSRHIRPSSQHAQQSGRAPLGAKHYFACLRLVIATDDACLRSKVKAESNRINLYQQRIPALRISIYLLELHVLHVARPSWPLLFSPTRRVGKQAKIKQGRPSAGRGGGSSESSRESSGNTKKYRY